MKAATKQQTAERQARINKAMADMDRLARLRRARDGREPVRWQTREPARAVNRWRLVA